MESSNSDEDFESADEDLDIFFPSKYVESQFEHISCGSNAEAVLNEPSIKEIDKELLIKKFSDLEFIENQNTLTDKNNHQHNIADNGSVNKISKTKQNDDKMKTSSKKLGTRITRNVKYDSSCLTNLSKSPEISKEPNDCKNVTEIKEDKILKIMKTEHTVSPQKQTAQLKDETYLSAEKVENEHDGWEIEEEENYSIHVHTSPNLTDTTTSTQLNQEQDDNFGQIAQSSEKEEEAQAWGSWKGWGVSSLISTATGSVSTLSSQVTAGLSTVMETTVGAPDPETLAGTTATSTGDSAVSKEDKLLLDYGGFSSLVSGVSFLGSSVINRGLDTLESLGKKTMEVLQEGDPGLMKKRALLFSDQDKPVLSQILREAKEKAENSDKKKEEKENARKAHFESLFDDFQGMVHLEALEMLSTQCQLKLQSQMQSLSGDRLTDYQETLSQVRDLCELSDEDEDIPDLTSEEFADQITKFVDGLKVKITAAKIINVNSEVVTRLDRIKIEPATIVNQTAISSMAEFTAAAMECFHKSAELLLAKPFHNTPEEAENYIQLTLHLCIRASAMASEFTQLLTKNNAIENSSMITNIFLEASNSCMYIRNACQLLIPILQVGAVPT